MAVKMIARCTKVGTLFIYMRTKRIFHGEEEEERKVFFKKNSMLYLSLTIADKSTDQTVKCYSPSRCICWNIQSHKQQRRKKKTHQPKLESGYLKKLDKYVKSLAKPMAVRNTLAHEMNAQKKNWPKVQFRLTMKVRIEECSIREIKAHKSKKLKYTSQMD